MKRKGLIVEIISALLIVLFFYTALSKLADPVTFRVVLGKSPLIGKNNVIVSWLVPIAEIMASFLLFVPRFRRAGLYASFVLMTAFTLYVGYMLIFTPDLPCSCGGVITKLGWKSHLLLNITFTILSLVALLLQKKKADEERAKKDHTSLFLQA